MLKINIVENFNTIRDENTLCFQQGFTEYTNAFYFLHLTYARLGKKYKKGIRFCEAPCCAVGIADAKPHARRGCSTWLFEPVCGFECMYR